MLAPLYFVLPGPIRRIAWKLFAGWAVFIFGPGFVHGAEFANAPVPGAASAELTAAWQRMAMLDFRGAEASFDTILAEEPESRHARLGRAIVRLNRPPKTNAGTAEVAGELEEIRALGPDDELGMLAEYELARLHHVHFYPADLDEARRRYAALYDAHPRHYLGQNALLRQATIDLFSRWPAPDAADTIARWEARKDEFLDPVVRRNFLRKLGDAILWFDLPAKRALPHFVEANDIGFARFDVRTLMMLKVYTISVEEDLPDLTRAVARRYLEEFPRDLWSQYMRERLAELEAESG